jgi:hypothetical protein
MYSIKKLTFETTITGEIFQTTALPSSLLSAKAGTIVIDGVPVQISAELMNYLINLSDKQGTYVNATTVTIIGAAAINPLNLATANVNEFDIYINGQYIDKICYTWTPISSGTQTITFDTATLGYPIEATDLIIINGRWA